MWGKIINISIVTKKSFTKIRSKVWQNPTLWRGRYKPQCQNYCYSNRSIIHWSGNFTGSDKYPVTIYWIFCIDPEGKLNN